MARKRRRKHLGISDKGWNTIGTGFKWYLILGAGTLVVGALVVGGVMLIGAKTVNSGMTTPPISGAFGLVTSRQLSGPGIQVVR